MQNPTLNNFLVPLRVLAHDESRGRVICSTLACDHLPQGWQGVYRPKWRWFHLERHSTRSPLDATRHHSHDDGCCACPGALTNLRGRNAIIGRIIHECSDHAKAVGKKTTSPSCHRNQIARHEGRVVPLYAVFRCAADRNMVQ